MKKITTLTAAAFAASALVPVAALAAEDVQLKDGVYIVGEYKTIEEFQALSKAEKKALFKAALKNEPFVVVLDAKLYNFNDEKVQQGTSLEGLDTTKAVYEKETNNVITQDGIKKEATGVTAVKAINQTVDTSGGALTFEVDGNTHTAETFAKAYEGYTVTFKADKAVFTENKTTSADGQVVKKEASDKFQYAVEVKDAEGKVIASKERATVTYAVLDQVIKSATAELQLNSNPLTSGTVSTEDKNLTVAVKGITGNEKEVKPLTNNNGITFETTEPAVATVDASGNVTPKAKGTATVVVKDVNGKEIAKVTVNVTSTEARTVSAEKSVVSPTKLDLPAGKTGEVIVELKDQFGDVITGGITVADKAGNAKPVIASSEAELVKEGELAGKYKVTVTAGAETATGKAEVKVGDVVLKEIDVKVTAPGEVDTTKDTVVTDKATLDLYKAEKATLTINQFDKDGVLAKEVALNGAETYTTAEATYEDGGYVVKTSDAKVATFAEGTVTGHKEGKATFTVYKVNGAFLDEIGQATVEITVKNSAPKVVDAEYKTVKEVTEAKEIALKDVVEKVIVKDTEGNDVEVTYALNQGNVDIKDGDNVLGTLQLDSPAQGTATFADSGEDNNELVIKFDNTAEAVKGDVTVSLVANDTFISKTVIKVDLKSTAELNEVAVDAAIAALTAKDVEVEDKSTAFLADGKSGAKDVTVDDAVAAMEALVADEEVEIELSEVANAKEQTVTVKAGSVTKEAKVNLTVVPKEGNGQTLTFTGDSEKLLVMVNEGGTNKRYTLADLKNHSDANIKALADKIKVENQTITIPETLLTTEQWTAIKTAENSKILRAYRVTILDRVEEKDVKIGKIAMYENGAAVIEEGN